MEEILSELLDRYIILKDQKTEIEKAFLLIQESYRNNGKLLICGNGGSASDSEHIVGELMKSFRIPRPLPGDQAASFQQVGGEDIYSRLERGLPAVSLNSQTSIMTAIGNDVGYDMIFAQQVYVYGNPRDVFLGMSTSGSSKNVLNGCITAKAKGMRVLTITGEKESPMQKISDVCIQLPETETCKIQELTLPIYHCLCAMLEKSFFNQSS